MHESTSADTSSNVAKVQTAAEGGVELCRRLLGLSRNQTAPAQELDLEEVVIDVAPLLGTVLSENIELVTRTEPGLGLVRANRGQIEHALVGLAISARDAMPHGGTLTIATSKAAVGQIPSGEMGRVPEGEYVVLSVSDASGGTPDTVGSRLDPSSQPDHGTGLGLFVCSGVVEQNGGHMVVQSRRGEGTTFDIYLPRIDGSSVTAKPPSRVARPSGGDETVLLAEDEEVVREVSARILRDRGYTVLEAVDGQHALRLAQDNHVHLLFTDVVMPDMTGWELAGRLRRVLPDMRVLYTSGYSEDTIGVAAGTDREIAFIEKPFSPRELALRIRAVLEG